MGLGKIRVLSQVFKVIDGLKAFRISPTQFIQDGKVLVTMYKADGTTVVASRKVRCHIPGR